MKIDVLTLFPGMFEDVFGDSIMGRAREKGLLDFRFVNIRDYTKDKHRRVDDAPYGGGTGLVMQAQPVYDAYMALTEGLSEKPFTIYLSPQGKVFNQQMAKEMVKRDHYIFICGHYEGLDERVIEEIVDMELSVGDFVLSGGEIAAMAVMDAVCRLVPGVLPNEEAYQEDSHYNGLLEHPQYTRPPEFMGRAVPEILLNGHHAKINEWRREQSLLRTYQKRPDLLEKAELTDADRKFLAGLSEKDE